MRDPYRVVWEIKGSPVRTDVAITSGEVFMQRNPWFPELHNISIEPVPSGWRVYSKGYYHQTLVCASFGDYRAWIFVGSYRTSHYGNGGVTAQDYFKHEKTHRSITAALRAVQDRMRGNKLPIQPQVPAQVVELRGGINEQSSQ